MARARLHCCEISPIELLGGCVGKLCAHDQQDVVIAIWRQAVGSREPIKQLTKGRAQVGISTTLKRCLRKLRAHDLGGEVFFILGVHLQEGKTFSFNPLLNVLLSLVELCK